MKDLFNTILQMNIYASIAIVAVIIFRQLFKKVPKKYICFLWIVVAFRLICPVFYESNFGILNLNTTNKRTTEFAEVEKNKDSGYSQNNDIVTANASKQNSESLDKTMHGKDYVLNEKKSEKKSDYNPETIINVIKQNDYLIWTVVILALVILLIMQYVGLLKKIKNSPKKELGDYIELDNTVTPFVCGIVKPRIYLPKGLEVKEKEYILLHEEIHIKNKDYILRFLSTILLYINWFNPLVWIAYRLFNSDLEMRCDEEVVEHMDSDVKSDYCISIVLHSITSKNDYRAIRSAFAQKSLGGMEVKMRIKNLLTEKVSKTIAVVAIISAVGVTTAISAQGKSNNKKESVKVAEKETETENELMKDYDKQIKSVVPMLTSRDIQPSYKDVIKDSTILKYADEFARKYNIDLDVEVMGKYMDESVDSFACDDGDKDGGNNTLFISVYKSDKVFKSLTDFEKGMVSCGDLTIKSKEENGRYIIGYYDDKGLLLAMDEYVIEDGVIISGNYNLDKGIG